MENMREKDVLINRTQMLKIAQEYNIFVSLGTIHRWANKPDFPMPAGKNGKHLLYYQYEFIKYLNYRLKRIQEEH